MAQHASPNDTGQIEDFRARDGRAPRCRFGDKVENVNGPGEYIRQDLPPHYTPSTAANQPDGRNLRALLAGQVANPQQHCSGRQEDERRAQNLLHRAVI